MQHRIGASPATSSLPTSNNNLAFILFAPSYLLLPTLTGVHIMGAYRDNRYSNAAAVTVGDRVGRAAAEECFDITNNPGRVAERAALGNHRPLAVMDIVKINGELWLCRPSGWERIA